MGTTYVPLRAIFGALGVDVIVPPPSTQHTLSLGVRHSPEFVCLPFKLILGNLIEALDLGADTLLMVEGAGLCRMSYYARLLEETLRELGYSFRMITTRLFEKRIFGLPDFLRLFAPHASLGDIVAALRLGLAKASALDEVERAVQQTRPRELNRGGADAIWQETITALDRAENLAAIQHVKEHSLFRLRRLPQDREIKPVRVGIIGELFVVLEPFSNLEVESELGGLGAEVHRTIMLSQWAAFSLLWSALGFSHHQRVHAAARPYLKRDVGGDGWESVGETVLHAQHGFDGMVHLAPFTCVPEVIAQNLMPATTAQWDIPVLTITCDEQQGKAGLVTRLEAFVDLLGRRRLAAKHSVKRGRIVSGPGVEKAGKLERCSSASSPLHPLI